MAISADSMYYTVSIHLSTDVLNKFRTEAQARSVLRSRAAISSFVVYSVWPSTATEGSILDPSVTVGPHGLSGRLYREVSSGKNPGGGGAGRGATVKDWRFEGMGVDWG